ncbi:MAG: hypothetical protein ACLP4V_00210 [Methylocella sp.]
MQCLKFVEEHAGGDGPYEVTQLVNSFLGALVRPICVMALIAIGAASEALAGEPQLSTLKAESALKMLSTMEGCRRARIRLI